MEAHAQLLSIQACKLHSAATAICIFADLLLLSGWPGIDRVLQVIVCANEAKAKHCILFDAFAAMGFAVAGTFEQHTLPGPCQICAFSYFEHIIPFQPVLK